MINVVPFKPEHLEQLKPKKLHQGEVPQTILQEAATFMSNGHPIGIVGGFFFVPGVFHIWGLLSDHIEKEPISFSKAAKSFLAFFIDRHKPRRLQMDIRVDCLEALRFAEFLGFVREGIMRSWGNDQSDYYLMSRIC